MRYKFVLYSYNYVYILRIVIINTTNNYIYCRLIWSK
uniref:Uncharacterized protein n=1 Tax=Laurencia australis TaxID=3073067 RepID=A0AA51NEA9_9FLOR|nr:hypothetical protein [Laurencia australis]WMP12085.1 hypothetical protein [Laurencia australis]